MKSDLRSRFCDLGEVNYMRYQHRFSVDRLAQDQNASVYIYSEAESLMAWLESIRRCIEPGTIPTIGHNDAQGYPNAPEQYSLDQLIGIGNK
jgi:hypothetical protein